MKMSPQMRRELIVIAAQKTYGDTEDTHCRHEWKRVFYALVFNADWKNLANLS